MIVTRKQWIKMTLMTIAVCLFFSCTNKTSAFSSSTFAFPTNEPDSLSTLIVNYCTSVLGSSKAFVQNGFAYNADQSAFVYLLCNGIGASTSDSIFSKTSYFKFTDYKSLGFKDFDLDAVRDTCSPPMSNDCTLAKVVPNLFNDIMNDYVNMKQPNLYGLIKDFKSTADIDGQINLFSSGYFNGTKVCEKGSAHAYPDTCRALEGYMKNVRNVLSDVRIFDITGVFDDLAKKKVSCASNTSMDIFACGLYNDQGASLISFVNLSYNEFFYYRLFMAYYLTMIQEYPSLLQRNVFNANYDAIAKKFSSEYTRSKDALSISLRMMRDTYLAFPLHIGFLMYQEDLNGFGKTLARIAPPIYTLYDKLRNVQTAK